MLDAQPRGGRSVGLGDHRHVALGGADHILVELVVGDGLEVDGLDGDALAGERLGAALHFEVHADLEQFERRQLADRLGAGEPLEHVERAVQTETRVGLDGEREPHVEVVVAQVVVRDAGVGVDDLGRLPGVLGVDLGGHEHRAVAESAGVVDRRDLADDPLVEQALDAGEHLLLGHLGGAARLPHRDVAASGKEPCMRLSSLRSRSSSATAAPSLRERVFGIAALARA